MNLLRSAKTRNVSSNKQLIIGPDEDLKSSSENEKGTRSKSVKNMKLRKTKEANQASWSANQDIGAFKEGYLCNYEEFDRETTCYRFSTQPEHAANWFHTKRSNALGDISFTSQATYTASELVLFKENNSLLKECATQTHVWKPGDKSLHLRPLGEFIPCTKPSQILHHLNLPFLEPIFFKSQRLVFYTLGCDLAIFFINQKLPKPCVDSLVLLIGELECLWIQVFSFVVDCGISQQTVPSVSSSTLPSNRVHWSRLDQTIETSFASSRIAYIQSLRNVSDALRARVQVQETSPDETYKAETYGAYSFLGTCCPYIQPPSPHNSQWDFFWNQFAPMDYNGYNYDNNQSEGQRAWEKLLRILKISLPPSICTSANEVSGLLEASKVQYAIYNDQLSAKKMLNPVALFSSTSSFSSSSRFLIISQSSSSDFSEESCMISGSHQSTLDRVGEETL
ncbi:unnamed protein product [Brassica napus]|uniref:(rape) hypothetical protein n=1 Tax=Brassica napus TaxID=3708 RepID=A0A816IHI2_BRANA|nr:unnamed protein product [Brassica napus]